VEVWYVSLTNVTEFSYFCEFWGRYAVITFSNIVEPFHESRCMPTVEFWNQCTFPQKISVKISTLELCVRYITLPLWETYSLGCTLIVNWTIRLITKLNPVRRSCTVISSIRWWRVVTHSCTCSCRNTTSHIAWTPCFPLTPVPIYWKTERVIK
jgi:hypothetical protein